LATPDLAEPPFFSAIEISNKTNFMCSIRRATIHDILSVQNANLHCLPENYQLKYYFYHCLSWPQLLYVAVDPKENVIGYVLAKMDDEAKAEPHGHITSLAVARTHRKRGIATKLMRATARSMQECFKAKYCSLHVRKTNAGAFHLYSQTLGYEIHDLEKGYYADGEDAYDMRMTFNYDTFETMNQTSNALLGIKDDEEVKTAEQKTIENQ